MLTRWPSWEMLSNDILPRDVWLGSACLVRGNEMAGIRGLSTLLGGPPGCLSPSEVGHQSPKEKCTACFKPPERPGQEGTSGMWGPTGQQPCWRATSY